METDRMNATATTERPETDESAAPTEPTPTPERQPDQAVGQFRWLVLALLFGFLGGLGGWLIAERTAGEDGNNTSATTLFKPSNDAPRNSTKRSGDLTPGEIYARTSPAVVHIESTLRVVSPSVFGFPQEQEGTASGSGFVIDRDGNIVTNAHVIDGAEEITVSFGDDKEYEATVVGSDLSSDIAVIKVDPKEAKLGEKFEPLTFADSNDVTVGDAVAAIGNPYNLDRTLTTGVVSALQRELRAPNGFAIDDVIQTDAAVNRGNSGGPLLNVNGAVIGVNSQIQSESGGNEGIAFAVPSNTVRSIVEDLIGDGKVDHAWLGLSGTDVDDELAELFSLPTDEGVLVAEVVDGSPADKAGIESGDQHVTVNGADYTLGGSIIVEIEGESVTSMREVVDAVNAHKPGESIEVTYYQGDEKVTKDVKLGSRPNEAVGE
jgi:S1-C subfamily serine protease